MRITLALSFALALGSSSIVACSSSDSPATGGDAGQGGGADSGAGDASNSDGGGSDAGTPDGSSDASQQGDGSFSIATHAPFPPLAMHSGKILAHPNVVSVTYANDANRAKLDEFGAFIVASQWLAAVGADYGVGPMMTHTETHLTANAPTTITDAQIQSFIDTSITSGTLPALPMTGEQPIYIMYFPRGVQVDDGSGNVLCSANGAVGYHSVGTHGSQSFVYAVVPDCTGTLGDLTSTSSHEIIEAASDPYNSPNDAWYMDQALPSPWYGAQGNEDADLCQYEDNTTEGTWTVQRSWSMTAAATGTKSPCVPEVAGEVYFNTTAAPNTVQKVAAGGTATFTITGWSTAPHAAWHLQVSQADLTDFDPTATLSAATIGNGDTVTVTLHAPANTASGKVGAAYIWSSASAQSASRFWPVAIQIQ